MCVPVFDEGFECSNKRAYTSFCGQTNGPGVWVGGWVFWGVGYANVQCMITIVCFLSIICTITTPRFTLTPPHGAGPGHGAIAASACVRGNDLADGDGAPGTGSGGDNVE